MAKKKKKQGKRTPMSKGQLIFQMRCNELAAKNVEKFLTGEIDLQGLMDKLK